MTQISLEEAGRQLAHLVQEAAQGEEVFLMDDSRRVAQIIALPAKKPRAQLGSAKGQILYIAPDFDAPLEDFADYS